MSNIVDDLLQEVEQLEESTQQLNENVQKVATQNSELKNGETSSIDADLIALETAKTAQEASLQSHLAAKAAVKVAEQLKLQSLELEEFNYNWRQSIRTSSKEIQTAKTTFIALMAGSVVVNIIALSVIGYFFYETNKQNSQFKGETLDIIQIESSLLSKKITLKVDELSSLIEALSADITRMKSTFNTPVKIHNTVSENHDKMPSETLTAEHLDDAKAQHQAEVHNENHIVAPENNHSEIHPVTATESDHRTQHSDITHTAHDTVTTHNTEHTTPSSVMTNHSSDQQSSMDYYELKSLVEKILTEQQKLQATTLASSATGNLDTSQVKKLNDISWLVRKQEKVLKAIQATLMNGAPASSANSPTSKGLNDTLNELKVQLRLLTEQQLNIQNQVKNLQDNLRKYASEPAPYSYKAK